MISNKQAMDVAKFGAIAGVLTSLLIKYLVMPILDALAGIVPGISAKLSDATISISVRESLTGINGGLSGYLVDLLGITSNIAWMPHIVMSAVGGAVFFLVGAYAADALGLMKGDAKSKTRMVIFLGSAIAAFVLGGFAVPQINIDLVNVLITFMINAAILAFVYVAIDKKAKIGLVPF